jgi:HlyD family secretion protein
MQVKLIAKFRQMSGKRKALLIAGIVVALLVVKIALGLRGVASAAGSFVTTADVAKKDIEESLTLKAPLEGSESVEVVSRLHYEVLELMVKEGDRVKKDQPLAILDSADLALGIEKAQDTLDIAVFQQEEQLKKLQQEYKKVQQDLAEAKRQHELTKALVAQGAASEEELKRAESQLETLEQAAASYNVKDGKVINEPSQIKQLEIYRKNLEQAQEEFEKSLILSPIDGTVTRVNIKVGRFADDTDDNKPMFVIENLDNLQMKAMVSEYDIAKVSLGQEVEVSAEILKGETVKGVVSRISPTGELKSVNSTERVIPIQIDITQTNEKLIAGITAKAKIMINQAKDVLVVPIDALLQKEDGSVVVLKVGADQTIEAIPVTLGVENDLEVQVQGDGLAQGDKVILTPTEALTPGMKVTVVNE